MKDCCKKILENVEKFDVSVAFSPGVIEASGLSYAALRREAERQLIAHFSEFIRQQKLVKKISPSIEESLQFNLTINHIKLPKKK